MYAILVVWENGDLEYLKEDRNVALFESLDQAKAQKDFMIQGMADEVQSINVIPYQSINAVPYSSDKRLEIDPLEPTWHEFQGRPDRDCELCGKPDRHPNHNPEGKFNG